jgi:predicted nucleic acid-binding protein
MALVVDTDVASFVFKHDTRAELYVPHLVGHMLTISFQTLAELELWALAAGWGTRRRQQLAQYLRRYLVEDSSPALCRRWAEVTDGGRRHGHPIAAADAWIAATALLLGLPLVTHNGAHYAHVAGLTVISEKEP